MVYTSPNGGYYTRPGGRKCNYLGTPYSDECLENGSGQCDGYVYGSNGGTESDCACTCHSEHAPEFLTIEDARVWHSDEGYRV
jgi:hypothetical protein